MTTVELLREQGGHVGLPKSDDIGEKRAAILIEHLAGIENRLFLILQLLEANRNVNVLQF